MLIVCFVLRPLTGSVWNLKSSLPTARQAQTLNALMATLSQCLELDAGTLIPQLRQAEVAQSATASEAGNMEDHQVAAGNMAVEEMDDDDEEEGVGPRTNGKATKMDKDFSDLLPVSPVLFHSETNPSNPFELWL